MRFTVLRPHIGDRPYQKGDTREAIEADVAHLIRNGVLSPLDAKAEPPLLNKAEAGAPLVKAASGRGKRATGR